MTKLLTSCLFLLIFYTSLYADTNSTFSKAEKQEIVNIIQLDNTTHQLISQILQHEKNWYTDIPIPIYTTPKNPFPINQLASYACQEALHG
jgi:hypothetical protein